VALNQIQWGLSLPPTLSPSRIFSQSCLEAAHHSKGKQAADCVLCSVPLCQALRDPLDGDGVIAGGGGPESSERWIPVGSQEEGSNTFIAVEETH